MKNKKIITLPWADKFRELNEKTISPEEVVRRFTKYCEEQEKRITEDWNNEQNNNRT